MRYKPQEGGHSLHSVPSNIFRSVLSFSLPRGA